MGESDLFEISESEQPSEAQPLSVNGTALEPALQAETGRLAPVVKQASRLTVLLKGWSRALEHGNTVKRARAAEQALSLASDLEASVRDVAQSWSFDVRGYLEDGSWREELRQTAAEEYSLKTIPEGDYLLSSPVVVRAQPANSALAIGKTRSQDIRPRVVAQELKKLREKSLTASSQEFLECLFRVAQQATVTGVIAIRFRDAYDRFCLAPGFQKDNPPSAFAQAIYSLHKSGIRTTKRGSPFEFEYPAANAREKDIFTVIAEDGRPIRYYGIHFR